VRAHSREITVLVKGAGIVFGGTIIGDALKYLFEVIVARNLGPQLFGIFFLGFTVFKVLERVSTVGLHNGVLRYVALFRGIGDQARIKGTILLGLRTVFTAAALISLLTIVFSRTISLHLFHQENLSSVLIIFALGTVFTAITEILTYSIQAFQIMKYPVLVRMIFEPGFRIVLVVPVLWLGWKLQGVLFVFLASLILGTLLAFSYLLRVFPLTKDDIRPVYETRSILVFSWPLFFVGFLDLFIVQINTLMLGNFRTSQEVGIYGAAQRTAFLIPIVLNSFNAIFAPMIADLYHRKELKTLEGLFKTVTKWIFTISLPFSLILLLFAGDILTLWGEQYKAGTLCLIIICCAQLVNCATGPVGFVIMMTGNTVINLVNNIIVLSMIIILNVLLIPGYGIMGAAVGLAIALIIINIIRLIQVYFILRIHPYRTDFYKPIAAGVSAVMVSLTVAHFLGPQISRPWLKLAGHSAVILLTYVVVLILFGLEEGDKVIFEKLKAKLLDRGA